MNSQHLKREVIQSTIEFYEREAKSLCDTYDNANMSDLHKFLLENLPSEARVMDIGFGSGRDLSFLKDHGFEIWGIDPSRQFVAIAKKRFPDIADHFYQSALPDLYYPEKLIESFNAVILIAVWMHLPKAVYEESVKKIVSLLRPSGKVVISYSITPREGESERYFEDVDSVYLEEIFEKYGCKKRLEITNEDGIQERPITWKTEIYDYDKP